MKIARNTSARMMPTMRASCWYFRGTLSAAISTMKTNRLSTESEYSTSHPV